MRRGPRGGEGLGRALPHGLLAALLLASSAARAGDGGLTAEPFTPVGGAADAGALAVEPFEPAGAADAGAPAVEPFEPASPAAGEGAMGVEAFEPAPKATALPAAAAPAQPTVRLYGHLRGATAVDTQFDSPRGAPFAENVAEAQLRAMLGVDVKVSSRLRLVLEGRALLRAVTERDFDRARAAFEPMLGDAFVDLYTPRVDLRVGTQRLALGAGPLAPADALNPRDLRQGVVGGDPEDAVLPVFAVRAQGELGKVAWLVAWAPFFTPDRFFVFGQDEALLQPALGVSFDARRVDPTVADLGQERLLETRRPAPFSGDLAVRAVSTGAVRVGASWVWLNEKLPRVVLDGELATVLAAQAAGRPVSPAATVSLLNRFEAGETLFSGSYARTHLLSLELSTLLGPGQLDADASWSPRQTFVDGRLAPLSKEVFTWVLSYSQASDSPFFYSVSYLGLAVPSVGAEEQLLLVEPATAVGGARSAFLHLLLGAVSYRLLDDRLELALRGAFEPIQRSWALGPRVSWLPEDGLELFLAAEVYEGPSFSPLGYFGRNDKLVLGVRWEPSLQPP